METILIVDDDRDVQFILSTILKDAGYEIFTASDGDRALREVQRRTPNLVLLDIRLPGMNGMKILEEMRKKDKDLIIIMLTAYSDVKGAVRAMQLGAFDYITKPFENEELILIIKKALQNSYLSKEVENLRRRLGDKKPIEEIMGESPQIKHVLKQVEIIAPTNMTVVIQGASGTGKELVAQLIHQKGLRKAQPFVAIDCGAIPETLVESELFGYERGAFTGAEERRKGKFEQANSGTLLLDEITNLSDAVQMKLLRVIQERRLQHLGGKRDISIDVRIIVASNVNLSEAVRAGKFRDDLYHRLNEFQIELPLLCERKEDIPILAKYFLDVANSEFNKKVNGISSEAMKFLLNYLWPGNVRELRNIIRRAALLAESDSIELGNFSPDNLKLYGEKMDVPQPLDKSRPFYFEEILSGNKGRDKGVSFEEITQEFEKDLIKKALEEAGGNKLKSAEILKMNKKTLYRKIKSLNISYP
ncbi:MAG: sigma-54-dependent Fis family transcriptional regulator [Nitrospirae bacterium]|nr:sigma-54-dependent Fis family transcriptional regulator [Nitrospirota bacterium]